MVSVKEATQSAITFAREVLGEHRIGSLLIEEIELSEDETEWLITISLSASRLPSSGLATLSGLSGASAGIGLLEPRDYKVIRVDAETGSLKSIKIRKV